MPKIAKEVLKQALHAIMEYIEKFKPPGEQALKAQLDVIHEIAQAALESAQEAEGAPA